MKIAYRDGKSHITRKGIESFAEMYDISWRQACWLFKLQRYVRRHTRYVPIEPVMYDGLLSEGIRLARGVSTQEEFVTHIFRFFPSFNTLDLCEIIAGIVQR